MLLQVRLVDHLQTMSLFHYKRDADFFCDGCVLTTIIILLLMCWMYSYELIICVNVYDGCYCRSAWLITSKLCPSSTISVTLVIFVMDVFSRLLLSYYYCDG